MKRKVLVVGGGAAGMMAALCAARKGADVTLLEPNERLGKKLNITGKGRCNLTNASAAQELLANVPHNGRFLYSAFSRFDGMDTMAFFEALGVPLKVERGNRVFPVSDRSFDVSGALERALRTENVPWVRDRACKLLHNGETVFGVRGEKREYTADAVIVATGGASYPATGSTGDGYRFAVAVGHKVTPPTPSLVPLECDDACCAAMQGLALKNVLLRAKDAKGKTVYSEQGELLFTHFGVSGPLVLSASAHLRTWEGASLALDLKPALDEQKLDARLLREVAEHPNGGCAGLLQSLVPHSMVPVLLERTGLRGDEKMHDLTREQRHTLIRELKNFALRVTGTRPIAEAIITSGGISVREIDPHTMQSKKLSGLYFCGEVLDVDAYTGGFNLQIAWATGKAAGEAAAEEKEI